MCWKTGPRTRSFSSPRSAQLGRPLQRGENSEWRSRADRRERRSRSALRAVDWHRRCQRGARRWHASDGLRARSCERLLKRFAATLTGDQDAAVSEGPRDHAANPRMPKELAVPIPHGALKRERPFRPPARLAARVLTGRARTLGTSSARDGSRSLTGAAPLRCLALRSAPSRIKDVSGRLAVDERTSRDVSGRLAARDRTSRDILGHPQGRRSGFADGCGSFRRRPGTSWRSAHVCVECMSVSDRGSGRAL
jgi:hypothetical protein